MLQTDLVTYIKAHAALVAIQGARFYFRDLPQEPGLPASTYFVVDSPKPEYGHDGQIKYRRWRVQFDVYALLDADAQTLGNTLEQAMHGWRATNAKYTAFLARRNDIDEKTLGRFRVSIDFFIDENC